MSDAATRIYQLGYRSAEYGPGLTCPLAEGPYRADWWSGYEAGLGYDCRPAPGYSEREQGPVKIGGCESTQPYDPNRG